MIKRIRRNHFLRKTIIPKKTFATLRLYAFLLCIAFVIKNQDVTAQNQKPNIILILADDVGYEIPTYTGGESYETPNIDALAQKGVQFTQCHATPKCSPSRFEILTGKYNFRNYTEWGVMDPNEKTLATMFKEAGYRTCVVGKWQLGGGDTSIHSLGFDKYRVWCPFVTKKKKRGNKYKNPALYESGKYLADRITNGKYGEDMFYDYAFDFIDRDSTTPFFIYYSMNLCHAPFEPTPDDSIFSSWIPDTKSHPEYFPSMVKYMDKKVGDIVNNAPDNTIIIFVGDNGTDRNISSLYKGNMIRGGKTTTTEYGTHVPLIIFWKGKMITGTVNTDLIDFTDFLPTLADLAGLPIPKNYGILDGVDFAPRLGGEAGTPREWIFYHYNVGVKGLQRWAQTSTYKLYDTSSQSATRLFYNIINDPEEKNPIPDSLLSPEEVTIKQMLLNVINGY